MPIIIGVQALACADVSGTEETVKELPNSLSFPRSRVGMQSLPLQRHVLMPESNDLQGRAAGAASLHSHAGAWEREKNLKLCGF